MRILYLSPEITVPGTHGGSSHVEGVVTSLERLGHRVMLLSRYVSGKPFTESNDGLRIIRLPVLPTGLLRNLCYMVYSIFLALFTALFFDIVYERGRIFGGFGVLVASLFGKKSVYEMNEDYLQVPLATGALKRGFVFLIARFIHKLAVTHATIVTATNKAMQSKRGNYLLVTYGVDPEQFSPRNASVIRRKYELPVGKTLLYTGSFAPWHACEQMIRAVDSLSQRDSAIKLVMIGDGEKASSCRSLVKRLGIEGNVLFLGKVDHDKLPDYINAADACLALFDRKYPPFAQTQFFYSPIKVHEYKACGKPVVASNLGNLKTLVRDGINGFLVDEGNVREIERAISKLIKNKELSTKIGLENRRDVLKHYSWDKINERILGAL